MINNGAPVNVEDDQYGQGGYFNGNITTSHAADIDSKDQILGIPAAPRRSMSTIVLPTQADTDIKDVDLTLGNPTVPIRRSASSTLDSTEVIVIGDSPPRACFKSADRGSLPPMSETNVHPGTSGIASTAAQSFGVGEIKYQVNSDSLARRDLTGFLGGTVKVVGRCRRDSKRSRSPRLVTSEKIYCKGVAPTRQLTEDLVDPKLESKFEMFAHLSKKRRIKMEKKLQEAMASLADDSSEEEDEEERDDSG